MQLRYASDTAWTESSKKNNTRSRVSFIACELLRHYYLFLLQSVNVSIEMCQSTSSPKKMADSLASILITASSVHLWGNCFWFQVSDWLLLCHRSGEHRAHWYNLRSCTSPLYATLLSMTHINDLSSKSLTRSWRIYNPILSGTVHYL